MHWSLTTFERKRIERIALDHPFFDMHAPLLTKEELYTILSQGPRKAGPQVIAEVKKELGLNDAPITQQKRTFMDALRDATFVPSFRRTVVLGALCLLLVLFMTLTVPGRTFAEEVYSIIIDLIDGTFGIRNYEPISGVETPCFSLVPQDAESPQALAVAFHYPIIASEDTLTSFEYEMVSSDVLMIRSKYRTFENKKCSIVQEVHGEKSLWAMNYDNRNDLIKKHSIHGIDFYIGTSNDGTVFANGYADNYSISISSRTMTVQQIVFFVEHTYICEY